MRREEISFKIDTTPEKYFHQLIEILSVFSPFNKMRIRQRQVFAEILYQFYIYRNESELVRERIVFDHKTRSEIAEKIGITKGNLYNIYKELRQLDILTKDGINKKYKFDYLDKKRITFEFKGSGQEALQGNTESDSKSGN